MHKGWHFVDVNVIYERSPQSTLVHSPSANTARLFVVAVGLADHQFPRGGRERRRVRVYGADVAQESGALHPALDVGHEGGRYDDDFAPVGGDELEQVVHSLDDLDVAETLFDLGSGHANLCVKFGLLQS